MAYTSADLLAVQTARLRGIRTVKFADRETTYTSDSEMRQVETDIKRELAEASRRPRQFLGVSARGLD